MNTIRNLTALLAVSLAGCSTAPHHKPERDPVVVIYHVKLGSEQELESLLARMWDTYMKEGMVCSEPHVRVRVHEGDSKYDRFIEIFVWRGPFVTEYSSETVEALMKKIQALCEPRGGQLAIEFRSAEMFAPRIQESIQ
jgi:hypothetical protein